MVLPHKGVWGKYAAAEPYQAVACCHINKVISTGVVTDGLDLKAKLLTSAYDPIRITKVTAALFLGWENYHQTETKPLPSNKVKGWREPSLPLNARGGDSFASLGVRPFHIKKLLSTLKFTEKYGWERNQHWLKKKNREMHHFPEVDLSY